MSLTPFHILCLLAVLTIGLAGVGPAAAQPVPCDQGVIRMPDRTGTVQICSALAAQVPALSKQLGEAVKLLGNQQQQIRELTRLTRAVNDSSGRLDELRQARLLKSLSAKLAKAESVGPSESRRTLEELGDRFDDLRESLLKARNRPESVTVTDAAMDGALGEAIAQLDWAGAQRQFSVIDARLQQIQGDLKEVKGGVAQTNQTLTRLEAEINPDNPFDNCYIWECALGGGASLPALQRLVKKGMRVENNLGPVGNLVTLALSRPSEEQEPVLRLLLQSGLDPKIRFDPRSTRTGLVTPAGLAVAQAVAERVGLASLTGMFDPKFGSWNEFAECLSTVNQGVTVTEVLMLLGHESLLRQALAMGFDKPRAELKCHDWSNSKSVVLTLGPGAKSALLGR